MGLCGNGRYLINFFQNNLLGLFIQKPSCIAIVTESANYFLWKRKETHLLPREPKKAEVKSSLENANLRFTSTLNGSGSQRTGRRSHEWQVAAENGRGSQEWQRAQEWQGVTGGPKLNLTGKSSFKSENSFGKISIQTEKFHFNSIKFNRPK